MWQAVTSRIDAAAVCRFAVRHAAACHARPPTTGHSWRPGLRACSAAAFAATGGCVAVQCADKSPSGTFRFSFCGKAENYTPVFYSTPTANTASVNAGDFKLYVGGGAINRGFAIALGLEEPNDYVELHTEMLQVALREPGHLVSIADAPKHVQDVSRQLGLLGCFARVPADAHPLTQGGPVGMAFVDVLAPGKRPLSDKNVAMLYVVGPKGDGAPGPKQPTIKEREDFLGIVKSMGANIFLAVSEYNAKVSAGDTPGRLPRIDVMQMCLVSGGVFRHPATSKLDVAVALVQGLIAAADACAGASGDAVPEVRFAYDAHVFEDAMSTVHATSKL